MRLLNRSAGRLSRHRRRPLAGLVVVILGLLLTGGLYSAFSPSAGADGSADDQSQIAAGRQLFIVGCAFCHGQNGEGVLTKDGTQYGPALTDVGAAAVDFQVSSGRMPLAEPGQQAARKPTAYTSDEIAQLAAYVGSLGDGPAIPTAADYSVDDLSSAQRAEAIQTGEQVFLTNCTACHNFNGAGGAMPRGGYAVSLHDRPAKDIYEAMLTGPQSMPTFSNGNLSPEEKRDVIAYIQTVTKQTNYGGNPLGSMGPVAEGLAAWVVGIGLLVGFAYWIAAHTTRSTKKKPSMAARAHGMTDGGGQR